MRAAAGSVAARSIIVPGSTGRDRERERERVKRAQKHGRAKAREREKRSRADSIFVKKRKKRNRARALLDNRLARSLSPFTRRAPNQASSSTSHFLYNARNLNRKALSEKRARHQPRQQQWLRRRSFFDRRELSDSTAFVPSLSPTDPLAMPTYTLRGVDIEFPYEAYDCQVRQERVEKTSQLRRHLAPMRFVFLAAIFVVGVFRPPLN